MSPSKEKKKSAPPAKPAKPANKRSAGRPKPAPAGKKASPTKAVARPAKPKPALFRPEVLVYSTLENLYQETAHLVMQTALDAVNARGRFVAALSGGGTPKGLFQQLTEEPYLSLIPWGKTYFFWVDERNVPQDNEMSNYRMAQEHLLSRPPLPKDHLFPMANGAYPADVAASFYENKIGKFFGRDQLPRFDLALLGMGEDGHTASLFPDVPQLDEKERWVVGYTPSAALKERISLTFPVLNAARLLLLMAEGKHKADRVKSVLAGPSDPPKYPVQRLRPVDGRLIIALDADAASRWKPSAK